MVSAFFISTGVVALSELGDKTQLFALLLSLRYRSSFRILAGIFLATLFNHVAIGYLALEIAEALPIWWLRMGTGLASMALGVWMLLPDALSKREVQPSRFGPFFAALIGFFILEIGDKTQIATMLMTNVYHPFAAVMAGSIFGMMLMNAPVVLLGKDLNAHLPLPLIRIGSALLFVGIGGTLLPIWN